MSNIKAFEVDVPREEVERLKRKLEDTRLPGRPIVPDAGADYGPKYEWAENLFNEWKDNFDWYAAQEKLNRHPHYLADIEDVTIHFLHARAAIPETGVPILLVHGWPGSFYEFSQVWDLLSNPDDPNKQAFNVVSVNMPGYGWSSWPPRRGWTLQDNARVFDTLMKQLGYRHYMVQCGDWAHWVGRELGSKYTDSCKMVHCNFAPSFTPDEATEEPESERERGLLKRVDSWLNDHIGYAVCMRTRPHTIGLALHDNPMGILMWIGEKYEELSAPGTQKKPFWTEAILTQASIYYFSNCIMPSMLPYKENLRHHEFAKTALMPENYIKVPFGFTSFYYDSQPATKRAVERTGNLVFYNERDDAGHFAALEHPQGTVEDIRELVKKAWIV